ncbi:Protein HEADING DATE REPRESSOR 1, partial [Cucurbita argyrosperma subsp. sororia]
MPNLDRWIITRGLDVVLFCHLSASRLGERDHIKYPQLHVHPSLSLSSSVCENSKRILHSEDSAKFFPEFSPMARDNSGKLDRILEGFSPASAPRIQWKSRRRSATGRILDNITQDHDAADKTSDKHEEPQPPKTLFPDLSDRRKALFEPLESIKNINGRRPSAESLLPPPDFDATAYPRGWLIGKKRKLVNVDVVESMRRIAIQEMNRKDREINGLNEQLDEDARCLEHLQIQLLQEKSKRSEVERENAMLHDQVSMLMSMLENGADGSDEP